MRLKSLEMHGFKSFPDRTKINFTSGVTVIVGPNGSGKSNISDAIRWVLGELSSKNVRGNKMEDVIFGGTEKRSSMGYAEVSLTIDNSGANRINIDYDEVTITRRLYRSGDSEYLINNKLSRLRDIHDMFFNTGIGKTGYSIIGQGKIAEIISQKSEERRIIFEEAAGISKYRIQKQDAERRLNETDENLIRLGDILSEIEGRVGPLEKEASKAKIYLDLYEKKKAIEIALVLYDIAKVNQNRDIIEKDYIVAKQELDMTEEAISGLDSRIERLCALQVEKKIRYDAETRRYSRLNEDKHKSMSELALAENELRHLDDAKTRIRLSIDREKELLISKNAEKENITAALKENREELEKLTNKLDCTEKKLDKERQTIASLSDSLDILNNEKSDLSEKYNELRVSLLSEDASKSTFAQRRDEIYSAINLSKESLDSLEKKRKASNETLADYLSRTDKANQSLKKTQSEIKKREDEREAKERGHSSLLSEIAAKEQRALTLRRMEEHFEGYQKSVKFVADSALSGKLRGICGPVSKLVSVGARFILAIETALGANIQNIVVEDEDAAKDAISLLKRENAGRATFYPLTSIKASRIAIDLARLKECKGFQGIASDLISYDPKYTQVMLYLLGRTAVFDNLDNASEAAKSFKYSFRAVTLDGQLINAGGSYTGGSVKHDSGILSRSAEIESIINDKRSLEEQAEKLHSEILELDGFLHGLRKEEQDAASDISLLSSLVKAEETSLSIIEKSTSEENEKLTSLENSLSRMSFENKEKQNKISQMNARSQELETDIKECESKIQALVCDLEAAQKCRDDLISDKNASYLACSLKKRDIENLISREEETNVALVSVSNEIERLDRSALEISDKENELSKRRTELGKMIDESESLLESIEKANKSLNDENIELEKDINDLRAASREKTDKKIEYFANCNSLAMRLEKMNADKDKLAEKLFEEYELTYADALGLCLESISEENRSKKGSELAKYKSKLKELGPVNVNAVEEYKEVSTRYEFLKNQISDLTKSRREFSDIIGKLENEMREKFSETFEMINKNFKAVFAELFGGGNANLYLSDPDNVLLSGIEIEVAPPGKIIKNLKLLSGGEQVFVAIAIFFAILKVNPSPFCLLDEIESALDEVNVDRFAEYAKQYSKNTQFIIITHRRGSMEVADTLYGITMQEKGISKVLSVNMNEIEQKTGVKL